MRRADRGADAPPLALGAVDRNGEAEIDRARQHRQNPAAGKGNFSYSKYRDKEVKRRLESIFFGKCAYCETLYGASGPMDVEHFRPKGGVSGENHPGYWWLASEWTNLLPSCLDCNRKRQQHIVEIGASLTELQLQSRGQRIAHESSGKHDCFPLDQHGIRARSEDDDLLVEMPLLLNPCIDDPSEHLVFSIDPGQPSLVSAKLDAEGRPSKKGLTSIYLYGLNRLGLVQDRTRLLRQLDFLGQVLLEISHTCDELRETANAAELGQRRLLVICDQLEILKDRILLELKAMTAPSAPYSTMAGAWLYSFLSTLS